MKSLWVSEIPGFEHIKGYRVYEDGNVESFKYTKPRMLKAYPNTKGYLLVDLSKKKRAVKVHRLVALAFLDNPLNKPQVNHIDCDITNNHVTNLQWVTNGENQKHAFKHGLNLPHKGEKNYRWSGDHFSCKKVKQLDLDGNVLAVYKSAAIAARSLGRHGKESPRIGYVCRKKYRYKTAFGYKWEYCE